MVVQAQPNPLPVPPSSMDRVVLVIMLAQLLVAQAVVLEDHRGHMHLQIQVRVDLMLIISIRSVMLVTAAPVSWSSLMTMA